MAELRENQGRTTGRGGAVAEEFLHALSSYDDHHIPGCSLVPTEQLDQDVGTKECRAREPEPEDNCNVWV